MKLKTFVFSTSVVFDSVRNIIEKTIWELKSSA